MGTKLNKNRDRAKVRVVAAMCALMALALTAAPAWAVQSVFKPLASYLEAQGMPRQQVNRLLSSPRLKFEGRLLARLLARPEKSLDYAQFLSKTTVAKARNFSRRHAAELKKNRKATGVPGQVVVAILAVESGLGTYTGRWSTMNVLASQAVLDTPKGRKLLYPHWPAKQRSYFRSARFKERLKRRAAWARDEVAALIRLAAQRRVSPYAFTGSVAGALGMCQFVPSSVLNHGADGDRDGKIDLNNTADAVHSVGAYLKEHGWKPGLSKAQQIEVVLTYNKSRPYAETVLALADKIK